MGKGRGRGVGIGFNILREEFAGIADGGEQNHARDNAQKSQYRLNRPDLRNRDDIRHDSPSPFSESSHQGTCFKTPTRTKRTPRKATRTAQAAIANLKPFPFFTPSVSPPISTLLTSQILYAS